MLQLRSAIAAAPQSAWFHRGQATINAALISGSLTAAFMNLGALVALSLAQSVQARFTAMKGARVRYA